MSGAPAQWATTVAPGTLCEGRNSAMFESRLVQRWVPVAFAPTRQDLDARTVRQAAAVRARRAALAVERRKFNAAVRRAAAQVKRAAATTAVGATGIYRHTRSHGAGRGRARTTTSISALRAGILASLASFTAWTDVEEELRHPAAPQCVRRHGRGKSKGKGKGKGAAMDTLILVLLVFPLRVREEEGGAIITADRERDDRLVQHSMASVERMLNTFVFTRGVRVATISYLEHSLVKVTLCVPRAVRVADVRHMVASGATAYRAGDDRALWLSRRRHLWFSASLQGFVAVADDTPDSGDEDAVSGAGEAGSRRRGQRPTRSTRPTQPSTRGRRSSSRLRSLRRRHTPS